MIIVGYLLLAAAAGWWGYKVYVSYSSAGGTDFLMPVYDGAMYPPILATVGLYLVLSNRDVVWSIWAYVGLWLGLTVVAWGIIRLMEELGDKPL